MPCERHDVNDILGSGLDEGFISLWSGTDDVRQFGIMQVVGDPSAVLCQTIGDVM